MSKKQSDADTLAKLQEMLGGRGVKDATYGPEGGGGSEGGSGSAGGSGGSGPAPDSPPSGGGETPAAEPQTAAAVAERGGADPLADEVEPDARDSGFVAFLLQCENELNASVE